MCFFVFFLDALVFVEVYLLVLRVAFGVLCWCFRGVFVLVCCQGVFEVFLVLSTLFLGCFRGVFLSVFRCVSSYLRCFFFFFCGFVVYFRDVFVGVFDGLLGLFRCLFGLFFVQKPEEHSSAFGRRFGP